MANLNVCAYSFNEDGSTRSIIIYGDDTKQYYERIKAIFHASWLTRFNNPVPDGVTCAWNLSAKRYDEALEFCNDPDAYIPKRNITIKRKVTIKRKDKNATNKKIDKKLAERIAYLQSINLSNEQIIGVLTRQN